MNTVVAVGPAAAVATLAGRAGVLRVDGDRPMAPTLATSHKATRSDLAAAAPATAGSTGGGVSVAVIDSGIDGTHPFFQRGGSSTVVANLKNVCGIELLPGQCFQQVPTNDTDTISGGGHGTHVAGIAAGVPVTTTNPSGAELRGSAPSAKLVGLSVGAAIGLLDAAAAQNWVLEHQRRPCAPADQQDGPIDAACPPIRVTNHSYGPVASEGEDQQFDEAAVSVQLQRALVAKGVTAVWAAGNDGGDGSFAATNPDAMDPTPGVVMVASYDDGQTGDPRQPAVQLQLARQAGRRPAATPTSPRPATASRRPAARRWRSARAPRRTTAATTRPSAAPRWPRRTSPGSRRRSSAPDPAPRRPRSRTCSRTPPTASPRAARTSPTRSTRPRPRRSTRATASSTCSAPSTC